MKRQTNLHAFHGVHPFPAFCYFAGLLILVLLQYHPIITLGVMIFLISLALMLGLRSSLRRFFLFYPILFVFTVGFNLWFNRRGAHILLYWFDQPVTLEALLYGAQNALMLGTVWMAFISYQAVLTPQKFLYLFARLSPRVALLLMMSLSFLPRLLRRLREISDVQRTRGIDPRSGSFLKRVKDAMRHMQILVTWSLEDAVQRADSMLARGYGARKRGRFDPYPISVRDIALFIILFLLLAIAILCWSFGWGRLEIYPVLADVHLVLTDWLTSITVWLFALVPVVLEGRELIRWRSYPSKI